MISRNDKINSTVPGNGFAHRIHSLESVNYLKIDPQNFIQYDFSSDKKQIRVIQQFSIFDKSKSGNKMEVNVKHDFTNVFSVRIHEITLRELILFQSLFVCNRPIDII